MIIKVSSAGTNKKLTLLPAKKGQLGFVRKLYNYTIIVFIE